MKSAPPRSPDVPQRKDLIPSNLDFPVVGIGASAGGLQAVKAFFEHMPKDCGMAFVVILHLSPDHQSVADKIIQESTRIPVSQVNGTTPIEKNHVYVISPALHLKMNDGYLAVSSSNREGGSHIAIDLFFRDLADAHKERAFCLILSGTGSDGAVGLSRIKEQGGVTLVQTPEDAEFDGMPLAAMETQMVDLILPVVEMPQKLLELWRNAQSIILPTANDPEINTTPPTTERDAAVAEQLLLDILIQLRASTGYDFKHYKRATVLRRIERRLQVTAQPDLAAYYNFLQLHPEETKALLGDMLIGVTNFFRDREAFEALERDVIPNLVKSLEDSVPHREEVRIWSAGCSTGEEAYSLAMLVAEQLALDASGAKMQVFATDIDERAITRGRNGVYPEAIITDVPPPRLRQYFTKEKNQHYRVRKEIREKVLFAKHSLLADPPFSQIDLIVCRNLLIYLDREVQRDILQMFHFALRPGGYLFLGSSESADGCLDLFVPVDKRNRIFRVRAGSSAIRRAPTMPRGGYLRPSTASIATEIKAPSKVSFANIHLRALEKAAPPSVIVDINADILHMSEGAGRFLRYVAGEVTHNLLALVHPDLRLDIRTTLFQVQQSNMPVTSRKVRVQRDQRSFMVDVTACPYRDDATESDYVLVIFQESEIDPQQADTTLVSHAENAILRNLERELQRTKLHLQDTIEQSEVSSEELKASNEEMQAVNEELRSATEELETSKEELQSINEELLTVNYELKTKVEETDKVNDYLTNLIASTDIATVFVDRNMRIRWFTPRATDIFSMLPVDTGRSLMDITHRLDYPAITEDATTVFESLSMIEREISSKDNRWYIARLLPYRSNEDHIDGTVLTFIDITKRRQAEEELRLGEERMRLVAESTHDFAIIILDDHGAITDWNTGAELIFGYTKDEVLGAYYDLIFSPEDRSSGVPESELRAAREHGRGEDERWHVRKDGSRFYCSGEITQLKSDSLQGYVKIARDLTGHKRTQDEQSQRLMETQTKNHLKDEFFAVMSHELKHPLNLIQLNAELLRRLPATKAAGPAIKAVNTICEAVSSQARIIDDLLDVARVRTGKLKLKKQRVDLIRTLTEIHGVVLADGHRCQVTLQTPSDHASLIVDVDPTRIEQVIWNLVNNALKFTPEGGQVQLVLSRTEGRAQLDVIDSGIGLADDSLEKIFDLFGQAENQHQTHQREGLGIGLSLVRQLVEAHEGSVSVHSKGLGFGCTFSVWLPLCEQQDHLPLSGAEQDEDERLHGVKVLLVDDSAEVLEVLNLLLEMEGAQVNAFNDPQTALETARDAQYDLIISDIGMPKMNGHELMQKLRTIGHLRQVPAIALTGYGAGSDQKKAAESGFTSHLSKPVAHESLIDLIEKLCRLRR
ncbi:MULTISPECIES: CheR family methyltransferase [Pseudomonas fluorescens group]|uniref:histidine kinase n=1 Tax=Pseudomonas fluorescens TaxID=294 RepID=A0A0D0TU33_PSEFL|nr:MULTISPECIES: CheR family methyltransferase [Pseudomonas fluorescens group]AZE59932.1 Chemotaxis protein methyltransferase CheR [Pseudomonas synxantha]KIR24325.1 Aerobic respiration control sensor protein ArcB [Pseudomonas fluorescens]